MFYTKVVENLVQIIIKKIIHTCIFIQILAIICFVQEGMKILLSASTSLNIFTIQIHFRVFLIIPWKNTISDKKNKTKLNSISWTISELSHFQKQFFFFFFFFFFAIAASAWVGESQSGCTGLGAIGLSFQNVCVGMDLRTSDDPYQLEVQRATFEQCFSERGFLYIALCLLNRLPASLKEWIPLQHLNLNWGHSCL